VDVSTHGPANPLRDLWGWRKAQDYGAVVLLTRRDKDDVYGREISVIGLREV